MFFFLYNFKFFAVKRNYCNIPLHVKTDDEVDESKSYPDVNCSDKQYGSSQFKNDFPR